MTSVLAVTPPRAKPKSDGHKLGGIVVFLKANYERIPANGDIPMIAANDILRTCVPARFNGRETGLVASEASFDVLGHRSTSC